MTFQLHPRHYPHSYRLVSPSPIPEKKRGADGVDWGLMRCLRSWRRFRAADQQTNDSTTEFEFMTQNGTLMPFTTLNDTKIRRGARSLLRDIHPVQTKRIVIYDISLPLQYRIFAHRNGTGAK
ncbi:hypothetical protein CEXT_454151 [Caerostris extrusa]|uniref:Uncharacterized protein n=1 Tax=Caerostris extrusa TaxID=172846 RepID=A0AAV4WT37_CAEEX|nr:hypothetical protein CEXT_454151 [Caerostris extrusa]